jgi:hypothetical protein
VTQKTKSNILPETKETWVGSQGEVREGCKTSDRKGIFEYTTKQAVFYTYEAIGSALYSELAPFLPPAVSVPANIGGGL